MLCELTAKKAAELLQPSICITLYSIYSFFTCSEDGMTQSLLPSSVESHPLLPNSHGEFGRREEHMLQNCKARPESSRDVSVPGSVTEGPSGLRSEGLAVTWWKRGVSCLTARKIPQIDNLDKKLLLAVLSLAYSCFQFLTLSDEIYITCHIPRI